MITDWYIHMLLERTAGSVLSLFPCISIELFHLRKVLEKQATGINGYESNQLLFTCAKIGFTGAMAFESIVSLFESLPNI